jgi:hypothetical protein
MRTGGTPGDIIKRSRASSRATHTLPNARPAAPVAAGRRQGIRPELADPRHPGTSERSAKMADYLKILTAREITSPKIMSEETACTVIANLAQRASGIMSVGLNAVASVKPR